jgi:hypothetical protein
MSSNPRTSKRTKPNQRNKKEKTANPKTMTGI